MLLLSVLILLVGCGGKNNSPSQNETPKKAVAAYELSSNVQIHEVFLHETKKCALKAYQTGYSVLEGKTLFNNATIDVLAYKTSNTIDFDIFLELSAYNQFPKAYNKKFKQQEIADRLRVSLSVKDKKANTIATVEETTLVSENQAAVYLALTPKEYHSIAAGINDLQVEINTEFVSVYGDESGVKPAKVKLKVPFKVPKIHQATLFFKSLVLNENKTKALLGDNDWNDPAPETGLIISYEGIVILNEFKKNSFELSGDFKEHIFYTSENDTLKINIVDVDYGLNGNDFITDTLLTIKSLVGNDYKRIEMDYVDEFLIYAKYNKAVN